MKKICSDGARRRKKMKRFFILCFVVLVGLFIIAASSGNGKVQDIKYSPVKVKIPDDQSSSAIVKRIPDFGDIPLYFIPNQGQVDEKARFYAKTSRYTLWMTTEGLVFDSIRKKEVEVKAEAEGSTHLLERDVSRLLFLDACKNPGIVPIEKTQHRVNYFKGKDRSKWQKDIHTSKAVLYKDIYKNIDLKIYGIEKEIEYDWLVKPGANPGDIRFKYENVSATAIDSEGNLVITTKFGDIMHKKPVSYQLIKGEKQDIPSGFKQVGKNTYAFYVENYNADYQLVIDPVVSLDYSTYLGGADNEYNPKIAVDRSGYIYVTGYTLSDNFPRLNAFRYARAGSYDVFLTKFNPSGQNLFFSTYFGGSSGDCARDIAVSKDGYPYITGYTTSSDLPLFNGYAGGIDAFVVKFHHKGYVLAGRYVGGVGREISRAIAIDNENNVFITGTTTGGSFPLENPYQTRVSGDEAFVCMLKFTLTDILYSTYLGGSHHDHGVDIAVDNSGYFYVAGYTKSSNFPRGFNSNVLSSGGKNDVFACKFKPDGSALVYAAVWGGNSDDFPTAMALDNSGSVYTAGHTGSPDFPVKNAYQDHKKGQYDVFISKLKADGSDLVYSTYLGGTNTEEYPAFLTVDNPGNLYVTGTTKSPNFPRKNALQKIMNGWGDGFFTVFTPDGTDLVYSSFLGGSDQSYHYNSTQCTGITMDHSGNIYIAGRTDSLNFPLKDPYQAYNKGKWDAFAAKFSLSGTLTVKSTTDPGVPITVSPVDKNGNGSGNTDFTRNYNLGTVVKLTAPGTFNGKSFSKWTIDGTGHFNRTIQVPMSGDPMANVEYGTPASGEISLDATRLNFGVCTSGPVTGAQDFSIDNNGSGTLNWAVSDDAPWLHCSPTSGTNSGQVTVSVNVSGFAAGAYNGTITVTSPDAVNSPQTVDVIMVVYNAGNTAGPIGYFESPGNGATVKGSIPVTGWALDNIEVQSLKIYRGQDENNLVYIGDAVFVEGARPDVQQAYPDYPRNSQAGWGYMMLTNFLPNGGNGTFTLHAIARDKEGNKVSLGTKTIICDNANAVEPFGAIDTPPQGGTASGSSYRNQGWVLTPPPNKIPENGSTITVYVDGVKLGNPVYNIYRADIAVLFPGYANSNGAKAYFDFDTSIYKNGVHTIQWTAIDNAGNIDGIGSRYFTTQNTTGDQRNSVAVDSGQWTEDRQIPIDYATPVRVKKGWEKTIEPKPIYPDDSGIVNMEIEELQRMKFHLTPKGTSAGQYSGFLLVGNQLEALPIGSTLDTRKGIFYWSPGPGFIGSYQFVFLKRDLYGEITKTLINVKIVPKF